MFISLAVRATAIYMPAGLAARIYGSDPAAIHALPHQPRHHRRLPARQHGREEPRQRLALPNGEVLARAPIFHGALTLFRTSAVSSLSPEKED